MSELNTLQQRIRDGLLFDSYSSLISKKQYAACEMILLQDLSFSEAAEKIGVSRQGVHDLLTRAREHMENYEISLRLLEKNSRIAEIKKLLEINKDCIPSNFYNQIKSLLIK
ncbi:MAG: DUF134 domain-containing protein [Synergistaceae bacterium]|jgi:predicted DNA-binding protein YlxM (UPF0122 family)|nr:DUF134 domain-containing protein [Synergistaceae bacterium]